MSGAVRFEPRFAGLEIGKRFPGEQAGARQTSRSLFLILTFVPLGSFHPGT